MDPWYRILLGGVFLTIFGVGLFWLGLVFTSEADRRKRWIGVALACAGMGHVVLGIACFWRLFQPFVQPRF
jgi:hypothetical protein